MGLGLRHCAHSYHGLDFSAKLPSLRFGVLLKGFLSTRVRHDKA